MFDNQDPTKSMVLFMFDFGIYIMTQSEKYDGTFKKCPFLLKQLLTAHAIY